MAVEDRTRHDRLRSLFPLVYDTDPQRSALGRVLDVLADGVRELDQATERALRDKWVATADGRREPTELIGTQPEPTDPPTEPILTVDLGGQPRPLEHLGSALDLLRQPWELDEQAYRERVQFLAPLMSGGLGTARALIAFTIGALGAQPCAQLERSGDTTTGFGLAPGALARCRACQGGTATPSGPCPLRAQAVMSVSLVDNPRRRVRLTRQSLRVGDDGTASVLFDSESLFADLPEIELTIPDEATRTVVPSFRNRGTGERIIVAHQLEAGQTLTMFPVSPHDPSLAPHRQRWVDR
ncbi:MAG: hypothetical protein K0V04_31910, partial [Deltaproteobacteria bacterium]|nr:hypothetical protein [Deltaproteobacteria bacterium]